jgi:aminoglycoside phosphotransferase (APT) family kinase protein
MTHAAHHGVPVPIPLAVAAVPDGNPIGLPFEVLPAVPGRPMLTEIVATPWRYRRALDDLAVMAVAIHAVPIDGLELPGAPPLVDRWRARLREDAGADPIVGPLVDRLDRHADRVRDEHPVLCHGDYHPLNVLSTRTATGWDHQVIDWTDAALGDREYDVARTAGLMSLASIAAGSTPERVALRAVGPIMRSTYLRRYGRRVALDPLRLRFWEAAHLVKGVSQVRNLDRAGPRTAATAGLDNRVESLLIERSERALRTLDETA